jgi:hypothetical protein
LTTAAVTTVRDEADVIGGTLAHMADEVDVFVVCDNGSVDGTRKIIDEFAEAHAGRVLVVDDPEVGYYQSERMSRLAALAHDEFGASWIVPFDADELWVFRGNRIADELERSEAPVVTAELFNYFPSAVDPAGDDPFVTIRWRQRQHAHLPKVAFSYVPGCVIHQGNHGVTLAEGLGHIEAPGLQISHFPYRSAEQFVGKARNGAAAYAATDLPPDVGAHWRGYGELLNRYGPDALHSVFREHFWNLSPADAGLVLDPAPYMRWER